jgi:glycolate oxidase FAD binding subunit
MATGAIIRPTTEDDLKDAIADAARAGARLEIRGSGSKAGIGAPREAAVLDMTGFAGIIDYDPAELVLTVGAATPLAQVEALVAAEGQMLAFDPFDHGPIFGRPAGTATIGGIVAAGVSGSRRVSRGGARDHLLGFHGVSGRGEAFVGGAKVVKNVTGYDLPKVVAGSWGRLAALTEVTVKVLPAGREQLTLALEGLDAPQAQAAMARAMGSQADVAAAAHLPGPSAVTALRLEGFGPSVAARRTILAAMLADVGALRALDEDEAQALWTSVRTLAPLGDEPPLWRINTPPSQGPRVVAALAPLGARWLFDWAGGLIWLAFDGDPAMVRAAAEAAGGHAALVRAPDAMRHAVPALHPQSPGVRALEARVRRAFDPLGVFETGRFLDDTDAD